MNKILNHFEKIDPISNYMRFKTIILNIKEIHTLLEIGKLLEKRLKELN